MRSSYLTVTDQFCGAGGSTIGAQRAGVEVKLGLNHWKVAVETYNANHPNTDVECANISLCDPRRYRSTDILITSPECTTHSPAGGNRRRRKAQLDAFIAPEPDDPSFDRSRATAWDVVRFAEVHRYRVIVTENVYEFTCWELFSSWLSAMHCLGYRHRIVSLNSMFCHPTPQSRDRVYVVFWQKGNPAPDLDVRARAWCLRCERQVDAVQTWKNGRTIGKYRQQYVYSCPACRTVVTPYYFAALNALNLSLPAERIGDRKRPLAARTIERVRYGLEKYGRRLLLLRVSNGYANNVGVSDGVAAWPTQTARQDLAMRTNATGTSLADALTTICGGNHHLLVQGAALLTLRDHPNMPVRGLEEALATQIAKGPQDAIISTAPFLLTYQNVLPTGLDEPVATVTTIDRTALIGPDALPAVEDCYFRMLEPSEIGRAMAFPDTYRVIGTKRDRVKQYGNAVTPPAMDLLIQRAIASLHPELA